MMTLSDQFKRLRAVAVFAFASLVLTLPLALSSRAGAVSAQTETARLSELNADVVQLYREGRFSEAVPLAEAALALAEKELGPDHPSTLISVGNLAGLYRSQGRYDEAEPLYRRALEGSKRVLGPDHPDTLRSVSNLAELHYIQGRYDEAELLYLGVLEAREKVLGPDHPDTLTSVNNLAVIYDVQGRFDLAEPLYRRALESREEVLGPDHPDILLSLNNLAVLYQSQGRYGDAEPLYLRGLETFEKILGPDHPSTLISVNNLAGLYKNQGRYDDAEPLFRRAVETREEVLGPDHPDTLHSVNNLAGLYRLQGRYDEAEPLYRRAVTGREVVLGPDHPDTLTAINNLSGLYESQGRYDDAEPLYLRGLETREKVLGPDHPSTLTSVNNLASLYHGQGRYDEAEPLFRRALEAREKVLGPDHPDTLGSLSNYFVWRTDAQASGLKSDWAGDQRALALLQSNLAALDEALSAGTDPSRLDDPTSLESRAAKMIASLQQARQAGMPGSDALTIRNPTFQLIQRFNGSSAAQALQAAAERLAITDSAQRRLLDDITDLKTELEANVAALDALRRQPERNLELEGALENKRTQVSRQIRDLEEAFTDDSYRSTELLGLAHVALLDVIGSSTSESLLAPHEALLVYSSLGGAYLINITTGTGISTTVAATDAVPDGVTPATIARLLEGLTLPKFVNAQGESDPEDLPPFDLGLANLLYDTLIGPVLPHLDGITELIIVADGPLQSLPFSVLVEQAAPDEDAEGEPIGPFERYRQSRFLVDRFAISVQPSVSSLRTLRAEIPRSQGDRPLLGFGDPLLKPGKADQGTIIRTANQVVENKPILVPMSGQVDAESLEDLGDLPQTKALLISIGETLGANPLDLRYGEYAEEVEIRFLAEQDRLKRYRTIVFATHALVSDEISAIDLKEPAIVMSLPAAPDGEERPWENDGLLRASDIIRMKLDADLVVLAACNTAKPDGTPGAEPLSGLAKAFLYAGARSLLVSHWQADAPSTARLVPTMLNYANDNDMTLAKALALAKRELRQSAQPKTAHYAHPAIWAPFSIVGNTKKQN